jgi:hypothetical protein
MRVKLANSGNTKEGEERRTIVGFPLTRRSALLRAWADAGTGVKYRFQAPHKGESNGPDDDQKSKNFQQDGGIERCRLESGSETESGKQSPVAPKAFERPAEIDLSQQELKRGRG